MSEPYRRSWNARDPCKSMKHGRWARGFKVWRDMRYKDGTFPAMKINTFKGWPPGWTNGTKLILRNFSWSR